MDLSRIKTGDSVPKEVNVIIEISANSSPVKYEFDKSSSVFKIDRFIPTAMFYPANYGFIPHTQSGDGDPVDVLVITRFPVMTGAVIAVKPIGVLLTQDESGEDAKILAVPTLHVDFYYANINNYDDLSQLELERIAHFFANYKQLEKNKHVSIGDWKGHEYAEQIILNSLDRDF